MTDLTMTDKGYLEWAGKTIADLKQQNAEKLDALKAILDIDNPPAGELGHIDFNDAIEMGRQAISSQSLAQPDTPA